MIPTWSAAFLCIVLLGGDAGTGFAPAPSFRGNSLDRHLHGVPTRTIAAPRSSRPRLELSPDALPDLPSLLSSLETFDGSEVADPVVVSSVFWSGLEGKIAAVVVGQVLAAAAFAALSSVAATQLPKIGGAISEKIFGRESREGAGANVARFASSVAERGASPKVQPDLGKLLVCIIIDTIGSSSGLIPILGEATDIVWAPIAALTLRSLYGSNVLLGLEFAEEILPFTDILPLATLCWVVETFYGDSNVAKALRIGQYGGGTVIDVPSNEDVEKRYLSDGSIESGSSPRRKT